MNYKIVKTLLLAIVLSQGFTLQAQFKIVGGNLKVNNVDLAIEDLDFINDGNFSSSGGNVFLLGETTSSIAGDSVTRFDILTINKSNGNVLLEQEARVDSGLFMLTGLLDIQTHDLRVEMEIFSALFNDSSYVQTSGTGAVTSFLDPTEFGQIFPIGNSTLNPIALENNGTADIYSVRVRDELLDGGSTGSSIDLAVNRTWEISEQTAGGSLLSLQPVWSSVNEIGTPTGVYSFAHFNQTWNVLNTESASELGFPDFFFVNALDVPLVGDFAVFFEENAHLLLEEDCTFFNEDINLPDTAVTINEVFQVENILTSIQDIESPANVIYTAGNTIFLNPDFHAKSGTSFRAYIASCQFTPPIPIIIDDEIPTVQAQKLEAKVFPNPFVDETNIKYFLPESGEVKLMISDLSGRVIHVQEDAEAIKGWQETNFMAGNLPDGMYHLIIQTNTDRLIKQIVVME